MSGACDRTVAVTGASGQVGTLLRKRLAGAARVLPLHRGDDWRAGIGEADAVVHLAGTLQPQGRDTYESANVATARTVAAAAAAGSCSRIVFLSYVGAGPGSRKRVPASEGGGGGPAGRLRGADDDLPLPPHLRAPRAPGSDRGGVPGQARPRRGAGLGAAAVQPLYVGDVVSAVERAVAGEGAPTGTFDLGGPEEMAMDDFVRAINRGEVKIRHLPTGIARIGSRLAPSLTPALMDLLLCDNVTTTPAAEVRERFGFTPHRLAEVWAGAQAL